MLKLWQSTFLVVLFMPLTALAEVSDKFASHFQLWGVSILISIILFTIIKRYRWAAFVGFLLSGLFTFATYETYHDPYIGEALWHEQGLPYAISSYGSSFTILLTSILGFKLAKRKDN